MYVGWYELLLLLDGSMGLLFTTLLRRATMRMVLSLRFKQPTHASVAREARTVREPGT